MSGYPVACIFGPDATYAITVRGKRWQFDWHHYLGPSVLGRRGDPLAHEPGPVLEAIGFWQQQGQRLSPEGECVWDYPPEPITEHIVGRHYRVTGMTTPRPGSDARAAALASGTEGAKA